MMQGYAMSMSAPESRCRSTSSRNTSPPLPANASGVEESETMRAPFGNVQTNAVMSFSVSITWMSSPVSPCAATFASLHHMAM